MNPALRITGLLILSVLMTPSATAARLGLIIGMGETLGGSSCHSCPSDAAAMATLLTANDYDLTLLRDEQATRDAVLAAFGNLAESARDGDICVVYYSGHGGWVADQNADEEDRMDETWVLYDGQLVDDDIGAQWTRFVAGVRVLFISDSCNSGTVLKDAVDGEIVAASTVSPEVLTVKAVPPSSVEVAKFHSALKENNYVFPFPVTIPPPDVKCSIISIAACEDGTSAYMGTPYSLFTSAIVSVWDQGAFQGSFHDFFLAVASAVTQRNSNQRPQIKLWGAPDTGFGKRRPFTGEALNGDTSTVLPGEAVEWELQGDGGKNSGTVHSISPEYIDIVADAGHTLKIPASSVDRLVTVGINSILAQNEF